MRFLAITVVFSLFSCSSLNAACRIERERAFSGDGELVRLARSAHTTVAGNFALYRAPLAVNTDGAGNSYHPYDFLGLERAINRIDNGIAIRSTDGKRLSTQDKIGIFNKWRDGGWVVPQGYRITWQNVIAARPDGKPCVFERDPRKGYLGSLTALKNGVAADKAGECSVNDQLDQRYVPAIVLRGENNPLSSFGAKVGDLVLALNPKTGASASAIVGDTGGGERIGEGSVALNMALLSASQQPTTYKEALKLDTGSQDMIVAVLPGSKGFQRVRPYSSENISQRVADWSTKNGYGGIEGLKVAVTSCAKGL
jgi:hypothetical protein